MARTKTTKSVRFKDRNSYRSASAHSVFRDASNDRRHSTTRRSKSTRPKTSTSTFSALFSMPVNQGPVDEMILGAPGTHLLLSRFAKDRDAIRRRFEERADSDKSSKKPKSRNVRRLLLFIPLRLISPIRSFAGWPPYKAICFILTSKTFLSSFILLDSLHTRP